MPKLRARKPPKSLRKIISSSTENKTTDQKKTQQNLINSLFNPIDNTTLIFFRCLWGLVMMYDSFSFIQQDYRKLENDFMRSDFYPKYNGFEWVETLPGLGMYQIIWVMFTSSIGITFGILYPISSFIYFIIRLYIYLLDSSLYSDQQYLIILISFIIIFLPANGNISIDSYLFPKKRSNVMSKWCLFVLQFQQVRKFLILKNNLINKIKKKKNQSIVYFYFAISLCNLDWIRGEPLRHWIMHLISSKDTLDIEKLFPFISVCFFFLNFVLFFCIYCFCF